jgi:hypothetical protein
MKTVYLSLGSNLGARAQNIARAIEALGAHGVRVTRQSSLYETGPVDVRGRGWFLNCAVEAERDLMPRQLMNALLAIERTLGRRQERGTHPWDQNGAGQAQDGSVDEPGGDRNLRPRKPHDGPGGQLSSLLICISLTRLPPACGSHPGVRPRRPASPTARRLPLALPPPALRCVRVRRFRPRWRGGCCPR